MGKIKDACDLSYLKLFDTTNEKKSILNKTSDLHLINKSTSILKQSPHSQNLSYLSTPMLLIKKKPNENKNRRSKPNKEVKPELKHNIKPKEEEKKNEIPSPKKASPKKRISLKRKSFKPETP